jgi:hypothetical protein
MNKISLTLGFMLIVAMGFGQGLTKLEERKVKDADIDFEIGDYASALNAYAALIEKHQDNIDLNYKIGVCELMLRNHIEAIPYLEKAKEGGEIEAYYFLGIAYHLEEKIDEEIKLYQYYKNNKEEIKQPIENVNLLLEQAKLTKLMMQDPVNVDVTNIGEPINSKYHDYVPLTYGLEEELYFTSRRPGSTGGIKDHRNDYYEDVYVSKNEHGQWMPPEQLNENINTAAHDACVGISSDGQILYIFRTSEDLVTGDLYRSEMDMDGWEKPKKLGSDINSDAVETSASISSDDKVLYFSSNREGGYGGMDLYKVVKLPNGKWSKATNLGPTINSEYDEDSPFIHADNKTLYFSSKGHETMGGYDVFSSTFGPDYLWTEPVNLGYPINTVSNDLYFVMSSDKQTGYYSSARKGGYGGQDIYKIHFKLEAEIMSVVKGGVESGDTLHHPVEASITLLNPATQMVQGIYKSNNKTGRFVMVISPETHYNVIVEAEGYYTYTGNLYFDSTVGFGTQIEEFKLVREKE